ncbi:MAG: RsmE family RNA methyltransferase [Planctomycetota bacterium]|jgi:16S rRNA (uracil1498-N3)-methyltransferase
MGTTKRTFFFDRPLETGVFEIGGKEGRHISVSFRLGPGDELVLIDGSGKKGLAEIQRVLRDGVRVRIFEVQEVDRTAGPAVTLAVSVPKDRRMDWLLEKSAELGVHTVLPVVFRHSVVRPRPGRHTKAEKWARIAREASKQSGRPTLLSVGEFKGYQEVLDLEVDRKILLSPDASVPLTQLVEPGSLSPVLILVGPEGGLDLSEEKEAVARGFRKAKLTPYTLRIETAAVAAAVLFLSQR